MKKSKLCLLFFLPMLLVSCHSSNVYKEAVAVWTLSNLDDQAGENSVLVPGGNFQPSDLQHEGLGSSYKMKDGKIVCLNGGWLDAGQGINGELNLTGKNASFFVRVKATEVVTYAPVLTKAGDDQQIAYSIAYRRTNNDVYIEAMIGSDDIGGAHLLKYKLPQEEITIWHTILLRFNGQRLELYVDGILRDDEVAVGDIRDWNRKPLLIGAQYKPAYGYGKTIDTTNMIEATFNGYIDIVALWNKWLSDKEVIQLSDVVELTDGRPVYYTEQYRPQFHFTAKKHWLNDPNGLVYYDGVYHLFFQYMPPHRPGAYKDWGHAVSTDLVHWEQIPNHITPHKVWSGCWSGSAIVDKDNSAGFQTGDKQAIIAFITNGGDPGNGLGPLCTQCIAYSNDGGMTFTYYDQNPVIRHIQHANRDPKVVWDKQSGKWIMSLYMDKEYDFGLFSSKDLKEWQYLSTVSIEGVRECPGFEPLPVDGDSTNMKWMFFGANGDYVLGSFDGITFTPETKVLRGDYGVNFYAAQTWNNDPAGRCVLIAWMPTRRYPGMPFEQQMNFPTEITLRTTLEGVRAFRMPVQEIQSLYDKKHILEKQIMTDESTLLDLTGELFDMNLELDVSRCSSFEMELGQVTVSYDASRKTISCGGIPMYNGIIPDTWISADKKEISRSNNLGRAPLNPQNGIIKLRILQDRNTIELFGNDGEVVISSCFMPDNDRQYLICSNGVLELKKVEIYSLTSTWSK